MNLLFRSCFMRTPLFNRTLPRMLLRTSMCAIMTARSKPSNVRLSQPVIAGFAKSKSQYQTVNRSTEKGPGFFMEQLMTACLSLYSYYIESNGEAAIIDPIAEVDSYVEILKERKTKLKYIFLTHFHADYVAGHLELQRRFKGCEIVMGPKAVTDAYKVTVAEDGQQFKIGTIDIKVLHTPGHTEESSCFLLLNEDHRAEALFTGDTMFINEVGRPDLAVKSGLTSKDLAYLLFDSLEKIKKLPGHTKIYPGHGAGSACGKNIGKGDFCLLETQKHSNYALKFRDKEHFAEEILRGMPPPPQYFFNVVAKNKREPFEFDEAFEKANKALTVSEFKAELAKPNTHIIDIRGSNEQFNRGVIKGSYYIGHFGPLARYVGILLDPKHNYLIVGDKDLAKDTIKRLIRIGYLNIKGYNKFPLSDWSQKDLIKYNHASLHDLKKAQRHDNNWTILDIRNRSEYETGQLDGRLLQIPLDELEQKIKEGRLSVEDKYMVHCASGYRAKIAPTILSRYPEYTFAVLEDSLTSYVQGGAVLIKPEQEEEQPKISS